jgi:hypothetical protein
MGAFTGATICWIGWGIKTPEDYFAHSRSTVDATLVALGTLGGYAAFRGRSRSARITTTAATILCAPYWLAFPDNWWVKRPLATSPGSGVPTADELHEAERETHLTFPTSSRILWWDAWRGNNPYLQMKFEMAASEWPAFIAASPFGDQPPRENGGAFLGVDHETWTPYRVEHLLEGEVRLPGVLDLNLGVDRSRADVVVVYLVWHPT